MEDRCYTLASDCIEAPEVKRMPNETDDHAQQSSTDQGQEQNRAAETDRTEPGERNSETAKDINVVRGDDRPQTVRHSG